jgi:glyoxylase-like metal-dependent hydrolase (beta-lactamase superfamily II)
MGVRFRTAQEVHTMKVLKIAGIVLGILVLIIGITAFALFGGLQGAAAGPSLGAGIDRVQAGYSTAYVLDAGNGQFALIDAGADAKGTALIQDLQARHAGPEAVTAILLTHSHSDHIAAIALFPKATIYALKREVPIAAGQEPYNGPLFKLFGGKNTTPVNVTHPLDDGESFMVGNLQVTAYAVPGHTEGSAAYLTEGVLFAGDALQINSNQQISGPSVIFSTDRTQGEASLQHLAQELQPVGAQVNFIASGHTGTLAGLAPLVAFGH